MILHPPPLTQSQSRPPTQCRPSNAPIVALPRPHSGQTPLTTEEKAARFTVQYGEMSRKKPEGAIRLAFGSLGPKGLQPHCHSSMQGLRRFFQQWEVDHFGGMEHQVNLNTIPLWHCPYEVFRSKNPLHLIAPHNENENDHGLHQQGGVIAMTMGEMVGSMHSQGKDPTGQRRCSDLHLHHVPSM
jgi:hypothetical protein